MFNVSNEIIPATIVYNGKEFTLTTVYTTGPDGLTECRQFIEIAGNTNSRVLLDIKIINGMSNVDFVNWFNQFEKLLRNYMDKHTENLN